MRPRLCLTLFITLAPPLLAQQAGPSTGAAEWRDSVGMWSDERLRSTLAQSPQGADPETRLRRGWVLEISGTRFDSVPLLLAAMNEFYEVTVRRSKWVEGWYGLGMAKTALLAEGAREIRSPHQTAGTGWAQGAANAFLQAQRVDPPFLPAAVALAKISPELRDQTSAVEIQRRLERAVAMNGSDPSLWVLVADAATRRGDDSAAVTALMKAQSLLGAPSGPILLALARAHFALGDPAAGADEYYRGAALPDSATRASYRYDVGLVADSAELAAFDATTADQFPAWLREFWGKRERESGRPPGSRLVEHERRYRYAREHFATIPRTFRQYGFDEPYRDAPAGIDDRGAVYVRHGSPDQTATYIDPDVGVNESWLYYRPEGNLIFHFMGGLGGPWSVGGWHLVDSPLAIPGALDHLSGILDSRMNLDPRFGTLSLRFEADSMIVASYKKLSSLGIGPTGTALGWLGDRGAAEQATIDKMARDGRVAIRHGLSTDSDPLRFDRNLEPVVQIFGAGDPSPGRGRLVVAMSIPYDARIPSIPLPNGAVGYTLRLRVTSGDDSGRTTLDLDSLVRIRTSHPLRAGDHLTFVRSYTLAATGDQRVRVILADSAGTVGDVRVVNGVPLPDLSAAALTLSDLIVGSERSGLSWTAPDGSALPLNPLNAWTRTDALALSFEVGGVDPGAPLHVRIAIGDVTADTTRPPRSSVAFDQAATGPRTIVTHPISLESLRPGRYLLTVTISSGSQAVRQERRIVVAKGQ